MSDVLFVSNLRVTGKVPTQRGLIHGFGADAGTISLSILRGSDIFPSLTIGDEVEVIVRTAVAHTAEPTIDYVEQPTQVLPALTPALAAQLASEQEETHGDTEE